MKKSDYLICYDICDNKRLNKIAKYLEKVSVRIQYSIFFLPKADKKDIDKIVKHLSLLMDIEKDDIRIYKIKDYGISMGKAYDLDSIFIIKEDEK